MIRSEEAPTHIATDPKSSRSKLTIGLIFILALWAQFCFALIPSWEGGTYYDYGWLVPPLIVMLAYLRWQDHKAPIVETKPQGQLQLLIVMGLLALIPIRIVEHVDALWRLPLWAHVGILLGLTHLTLAAVYGWARSIYLLPATGLILVAVPLPTFIQGHLVDALTESVVSLSSNILPIFGYPSIRSGTGFIVDGKVLDVAEGCSGIRSFQSCIMAALALGELRRFKIFTRVIFVLLALGVAVLANCARIVSLTKIAFMQGHEAMDKAHDSVGMKTAIATYALVFAVSLLLASFSGGRKKKKAKVVRRKS